jgi:hypothetical protein
MLALHPPSLQPLVRLPHRWRSSLPQGQQRGWRLHLRWSPRLGWWLDVAGPGPECLPSFVVGPSDSASLWRAFDASLRCATDDFGSNLAPTPGDPHLDTLVPASWRMGLCLSCPLRGSMAPSPSSYMTSSATRRTPRARRGSLSRASSSGGLGAPF